MNANIRELADPSSPFLEFENITVLKSGRKVLDSLSITIHADENIAILGPNGSGKSSFIKVITRDYYPVATSDDFICKVWGREQWHVFDLRSGFGIVSDDLQDSFNSEITGQEVILSGFFSSINLFNHQITDEMNKKAEVISDFLEINHLMDRKIKFMSSGEARRFLIGRALVHDPYLLILDEPTGNLDLHALHSLRNILRKIVQSGTRIILVTHNLHDIIPEINRVLLIKNGRIFKDGMKEDILTDMHIGSLFAIPVQIQKYGGYYYATGY